MTESSSSAEIDRLKARIAELEALLRISPQSAAMQSQRGDPSGDLAGHGRNGQTIGGNNAEHAAAPDMHAKERSIHVQQLAAKLAAALTPAEMARAALEQGLPALGAVAGTVVALAPNADHLDLLDARGYPDDLVRRYLHIPLDSNVPLAEVARSQQPLWLRSRDEFMAHYGRPAVLGHRAWAAVPLLSHGRTVGGLGITYAHDHTFGESERSFILTLAELCAQALERARLHQALEQRESHYRRALEDSGLVAARVDRELRYVWIHNPHPDFDVLAAIGKRDDELNDDPGAQRLMMLKARVLETGQQQQEEMTFLLSDGLHVYEVRGEPWHDEDGHLAGLTTVALDVTERKRAEEALRESEARMRQMADAMPQLVWMADVSGQVNYYNRRAYEFDGLAQQPDGSWIWQPVLHPDDEAHTTIAWREAVASARPYAAEHRLHMADGSYRWHLSRAEPARDAAGRLIGWFGTATDVHELKLAKEALEIANTRFRIAEEAAQGFSFDWDVAAGTVVRSDSLQRVLGYAPGVIEGSWEAWRALIHPEEAPADRAQVVAVLNCHRGDTVDGEYRVRHRDGGYRWMYERAILMRDERGQVRRVIGQTIDITERKQAEERLRESEARFRHLADATPVLVWISDTSKSCTYFNHNWLQFTGRALEQELGYGWAEGVHPEDVERCLGTYAAAFDQREPFEMEYRLRRHDGEYRWILDRGVPNMLPDGMFAGYIGGCIDIHDRRRSEQDAYFLAGISAAINAAAEPAELMWQVVSATADYLEAPRAGFNEVGADRNTITFHRDYCDGVPSIAGTYEVSRFGPALLAEMRAGRTMVIADTRADPRTSADYDAAYGPAGLRSIVSVPLLRGGAWVASLWVAAPEPREWDEHELALLHTVADRAWLAVEAARLQLATQALNTTLEARVAERTAALRQSQSQLRRLSAYVERTREDERTRIAREVHDELGGALTVLKMSLVRAARSRDGDADLAEKVADMRAQIDAIVQMVRRISSDLRPAVLDDLGLIAAMEWQAGEWQQRTGIACKLEMAPEAEVALSDPARTAVFRAFQESLTNIARHAQATGVIVNVRVRDGQLELRIRDNGRGISADALTSGKSLGLLGMHERMREANGDVTIEGEPGRGTTVTLRVPVSS